MSHISKVHLIEKDAIEFLRFEYQDSNLEDFKIESKGNQRFVVKDKQKYLLIENQIQIDERVKTGIFERCIFLTIVDFIDVKFQQDANFRFSIFVKKTSFDHVVFFQEAVFFRTIFVQKANFSDTEFIQRSNFNDAVFGQGISYPGVKFSTCLEFSVAFTKDVNFSFVRFIDGVDFSFANIQGVLNLENIEKVEINLKFAVVNSVVYGDAEFQSQNRETFLTLKNAALKQNDQIKALEFHQQEYQTHYKNLTWKNEFWNKFVLGFENVVSKFGTSVGRSLLSLVVTTVLFYFLINGLNFDAKTLVNFVLPTSYDIDTVFSVIDWWDRWLFLFYKILQLVIIYEIIKSFRKFSRAL